MTSKIHTHDREKWSRVQLGDVEQAIREAEELLGRYRYDMRPYGHSRQKNLATAENLLTEARLKLHER